jgi:hypothetical protein
LYKVWGSGDYHTLIISGIFLKIEAAKWQPLQQDPGADMHYKIAINVPAGLKFIYSF